MIGSKLLGKLTKLLVIEIQDWEVTETRWSDEWNMMKMNGSKKDIVQLFTLKTSLWQREKPYVIVVIVRHVVLLHKVNITYMLHTCIIAGSWIDVQPQRFAKILRVQPEVPTPPSPRIHGVYPPWVPLLLIFSASTCLTQRLSFFVISVVDFADSPISWENSPLLRAQSKISKYLNIHFRHVSSGQHDMCFIHLRLPIKRGETFPVSDWLPNGGSCGLSAILLRSRIRRDVMMSLQFDNVWYCISLPYTSKFCQYQGTKVLDVHEFSLPSFTYPSPIQEPTRPVLWKCPWR